MSAWPTTIVQEDINIYAQASGDFNPVHVDPEFARKTPYGTTIAHGSISGAVVTRYLVQDMRLGDRLKSVSLKFIGAVRSGDSLKCGAEPAGDAEGLAPGETAYKVWCKNQKDETVTIGTAIVAKEAGR